MSKRRGMITALVLQLLAYDPQESYSNLPAEKLLEKRRMLTEERPSIAAPIIVSAVVSPVLLGAGTVLLYFGATGFSSCGYDKTAMCAGGGVAAALGLAALTFGLVWLLQRLGVRNAIDARIEELTALVELRRVAPAVPQPP